MIRKRYSPEEKMTHTIASFMWQGSIKGYCEKHAIPPSTLSHWRSNFIQGIFYFIRFARNARKRKVKRRFFLVHRCRLKKF